MSDERVEAPEPRQDSIFAARLRYWLLSGVLIGASVGVLAVLVLSQTRWGHERVLGFTLRTVSEQLDGTLRIERLSGNLLSGARLYGVSLLGPDDDLFLRADSAFVAYNLRTITGDEIVIDRLVLFDAEVHLRRLPGDSLWNYERIFGDTVPSPEPIGEPRRPLILREASVLRSVVLLEMPWEPDPDLDPAGQRAEVAAVLADTAQVVVREVPGGYLRTMRVGVVDADLANLVSAPDEIGGTSVSVTAFSGAVALFREPFEVRRLEANLSFRDALLRFRVPVLWLSASRLEAQGRLEFGDLSGTRFDVTVRADTLDFADLRPAYPPLPAEGGGALELVVETRPEGTLYLARDLRLTAPGTRLRGSFGMIAGDALRFVETDLVADPLRMATIEAMLPVELPVVGLQIGGVEVRQPAS